VDRLRANRSIRAGLWAATAAVGVFALTFYVATLFIGG
jgi:hypothetical protein